MMRMAVAALLLFCASIAAWPVPGVAQGVMSLSEMRRDRLVMQEFDLSCAAATLATLLNYQHGEQLTEREVALELINRPEYIDMPELVRLREGFSLLDLKRYVDGRGYEGVGFGRLTYEHLLERAPVIVPIDVMNYRHFVVFRGEINGSVLLADPAYGNRTMSRAKFENMWIEFPELGHVGFVVERRDGLIPPNQLDPSLEDFLIIRQ